MKIIADTNIYYKIGSSPEILSPDGEEFIVPTFVNLMELTKTGAMVEREAAVRAALKAMIKFEGNSLLSPPFIHIAQLHNGYEFDGRVNFSQDLEVARRFADGASIALEHQESFRKIIEEKRAKFQSGAAIFNQEAERIRAKIIEYKKEHLKIDTLQLTANFIEFCIQSTTQRDFNLEGFDLNRIELLVRTLDHFFKKMESSIMSFKGNDWYDFAQLAYVQPGDKFWTLERRWVNLIKEAGMSKYLY